MATGSPVHAQMSSLGGYAFTKFESDVTVNKDATLDVVETITGEFYEDRHGIYRNIPVRYRADDGSYLQLPLTVQSVKMNGQDEPYDASRQGDEEVIKIGDPDQTVTGPFVYQIDYRVSRAILYEKTVDQVYWNATGTDWDVPIPDARATIHVAGVAQKDFQAICYTGARGSKEQNCSLTSADGSVTAKAGDYLTVAVRFPKGIVTPPSAAQNFWWWLAEYWDVIFWIVPVWAAWFLFKQWRKDGKDAKGRGAIIPLYDPPDDLRPTEVGSLVDARVDDRDVSAIFVDLAVRGYLRIVEKEEKGLLFTGHTYTLEKLKANEGLKEFEKIIFDELFKRGDSKTLTQTDGNMAGSIQECKDRLYQDLVTDGYFADNPKTVLWLYLGVGFGIGVAAWFVGIFIATVTGGFHAFAALLATGAMFMIAAPFMRKRTQKGALAQEQAFGFKLFLETAERYRLQWQEREGIFEKFLPYAMVFNVTDKWTKAFEGMNLPQPTWYVGAYPGFVFRPAEFSRNIGGLAAAAAVIHAPSSSTGGGFSSGGFSGGGFGGGGGGSW